MIYLCFWSSAYLFSKSIADGVVFEVAACYVRSGSLQLQTVQFLSQTFTFTLGMPSRCWYFKSSLSTMTRCDHRADQSFTMQLYLVTHPIFTRLQCRALAAILQATKGFFQSGNWPKCMSTKQNGITVKRY